MLCGICTYALYPLPKKGKCTFALIGIGKIRNSITRFSLDALLQTTPNRCIYY